MKITFAKDFANQNDLVASNFPSDDIPQSQKEKKEYYINVSKAIIHRYINNQCELSYNAPNKRSISELRAYAKNQQDISKYKDIIIGKKDSKQNCRPKSTLNINWDTLDILPKKLGDVKGYMQKLRYEVTTQAIDPQAVYSKEFIKGATKLMMDERVHFIRTEISEIMGGQDPMGESNDLPQNQNGIGAQQFSQAFKDELQVEQFANNGGFQLEQEVAIKILLDKTDYESNVDVIHDNIIDDIITVGIAGVAIYTEPNSFVVKKRYIDIENVILPYSQYNDFRDITYCGEVRKMTIADIRKESDLSDAEIIEIARKYSTANGLSQENFFSQIYNSKKQGLGITVLDSIEVDVADLLWMGTKKVIQTSVNRKKENNLVVNTVNEDYKLSEKDKRDGKKLNEYSLPCVYKCKYILGCEKVFDYGLAYNVPFKKTDSGKMKPIFPFVFIKTNQPSLVTRCIGFIDDANIALYKKRNVIKKMVNGANIAIKKSALENVSIDGKMLQPRELMQLFTDEGFLLTEDTDAWGNNRGSSSSAITAIPTDTARQLMELRDEIEFNIRMIEEVTGLNQLFSASTPTSETGLGVAKIAVSQTVNSLYPIVKSFERLYSLSLKSGAMAWCVLALYSNDKELSFASSRAVKHIKLSKDLSWFEYDIKLEAGMNDDDLMMLQNTIMKLVDFRRQSGSGGITASDALFVQEMIRQGNVKQAAMVLAQIEEMRQQEDELKQQMNIQQNAMQQQQSNQQAIEGKLQSQQQEYQSKLQIEQMKGDLSMKLEMLKSKNMEKQIALQNIWGYSTGYYNKTPQTATKSVIT